VTRLAIRRLHCFTHESRAPQAQNPAVHPGRASELRVRSGQVERWFPSPATTRPCRRQLKILLVIILLEPRIALVPASTRRTTSGGATYQWLADAASSRIRSARHVDQDNGTSQRPRGRTLVDASFRITLNRASEACEAHRALSFA